MLTWKKNFEEVSEKLELANKEVADLRASFDVSTETIVKLNEENGKLQERIKELSEVPGNSEQLSEMQARVAELEVQLAEKDTDIEGLKEAVLRVTAAKEELEAKENDFTEAVAAKALEITQAQGIPPLSAVPTSQPASDISDGDLVRQLENIKDPAKRREFWVKHQKELTNLLYNR